MSTDLDPDLDPDLARLVEARDLDAVNAELAAHVAGVAHLASCGPHRYAHVAEAIWGGNLVAQARRIELRECSRWYRRAAPSGPPREEAAA